jgi:hypothetical protein
VGVGAWGRGWGSTAVCGNRFGLAESEYLTGSKRGGGEEGGSVKCCPV